MTTRYTSLAEIRRFDQLIVFLREQMHWPIESSDFEELTFDYSPDELGIDTTNAAKIQEIKRLRPLAVNQPWSVFFVKFEPKRLPVVALRSILGRVTHKRRASASDPDQPVWAMEDLMFISNYGEGSARQISFAHFAAADDSRQPTLRVFGWDSLDTTLHLQHVGQELIDHLSWPDDEANTNAWSEQWRRAFTLDHREVITTAQQLAFHLAELARNTRDRISTVLQIETENGRITRLMKSFRQALLHDLDADGFADMVAQSIAYGLLSARITDPRQDGTELADHLHTNLLLRESMSNLLTDSQKDIDFDELGVSEVVHLLDRANIDAVLRDFGDKNPHEDPVIHFYESFLTEYDKQIKIKRGVFYTPRPVVSYIVRSVNSLLRSEFGLEDGLADTSTWAEVAERKHLTIPQGVSPKQDFVQILDPAVGTGTFLVEVIDLIHKTLLAKWQAQGHNLIQIESMWNDYVPRHLLPRLHGYELLMAPYAIAHLKIGLKLYETGYRFGRDVRARVYLTNALEPAQDVSGLLEFAIPALAHESREVSEVKARHRFTVVIGNPPYSGHSANKGKWIAELLDDYKKGYPALKKPAQAKWLSDDYVKFFRLAQRQCQQVGVGVIGLITNHSYLDNPTFQGMRRQLMEYFDTIYLVDLHGNFKKGEKNPDGGHDENVFDIQQGVAIALCVSHHTNNTKHASIHHTDVWGKRQNVTAGDGKYDWLLARDVRSTYWIELAPRTPFYLFLPRDVALSDEYEGAWALPAIFSLNGDPAPGIVTTHDQFAISWNSDEAVSKIECFLNTQYEEDAREIWKLCSQYQWQYQRAKEELADGTWCKQIQSILYRPFDSRITVFNRNVAVHRRERVMQHMLKGDNLGMIACRQQSQVGVEWTLCGVTRSIIESSAISNKTKEINYLFPLYVYRQAPFNRREPNFDPSFRVAFATAVNLDFVSDGVGDLTATFGPVDVFHYLYATLHSPEYRRRYADLLRFDFPRLPLPGSRDLFENLTQLGASLVSLHLMEAECPEARPSFPVTGFNFVETNRYTPPNTTHSGRVWINGEQYFDSVEPETYNFRIGSYKPAQKWLKDRKGRTLTTDDIEHYCSIISVLSETPRRMIEIDDAINAHGGWPAAFQHNTQP